MGKIVYRTPKDRKRVQKKFKKPSMTRQEFSSDVNINTIMKKHAKGQMVDFLEKKNYQYADVSEVPTYQEALQVVKNAEETFMNLSAEVRDRFANDPTKFLAFIHDEKNDAEARKLGLKKPKVQPIPPTEVDDGKRSNSNAKDEGKSDLQSD